MLRTYGTVGEWPFQKSWVPFSVRTITFLWIDRDACPSFVRVPLTCPMSSQWTMTFYLAQAKMSKSCAFDFRTTQQQVPGSTSKMSITSWRTRHLNWNLVERRCMQINLMPLYLFGTQLINSSFDSCFYFSKFLKTATFNSANISCRLHASCFVSWFYFLFVNGPIYMLIKRTIYMLIKRTRLTWNFEILSIYVVCH
jgi:hypothetical protein